MVPNCFRNHVFSVFVKLSQRSQRKKNTYMLWGLYQTFPWRSNRLRNNPQHTHRLFNFLSLEVKAFLTKHFESLAHTWSFVDTRRREKESSNVCQLQEFTSYWLLSTPTLLHLSLLSFILKLTYSTASLPLSKYMAMEEGQGVPFAW